MSNYCNGFLPPGDRQPWPDAPFELPAGELPARKPQPFGNRDRATAIIWHWLDQRLDNPIHAEHSPHRSSIWVLDVFYYEVDRDLRQLRGGIVEPEGHLEPAAEILLSNPLRLERMLRRMAARIFRNWPKEEGVAVMFPNGGDRARESVMSGVWSRLSEDPRFKLLAHTVLPHELALDQATFRLATTACRWFEELRACDYQAAWQNMGAFRKVEAENPHLLPLLPLYLESESDRLGPEPVGELKRWFIAQGVSDAAWPAAHPDKLRAPGEDILDAAKRLARELDREVLPIQGPPGSGKTYTGARAILELVRQGKRVGVTAVSHKVIDNLLEEVAEAAGKEKVAVRLLHKDKGEPPPGIEYNNDTDGVVGAIGPGTVVGGTAWLWADDRAAGTLDHLFIDEAGQMALAPALAASRAAKNVVLLGDPQQLEQPQRGAHPEGADVAALVHLVGKDHKVLAEDRGLFLDVSYRLHPAICKLTSELYYEDKLESALGRDRQCVGGTSPFAGAGLFLVEVAHQGNQAVAHEEVEAVARVAQQLLATGTTWTDHDGATRALTPNDLLVVAPYNAQVSALRTRLAALGVDRVGTVDKFQGQEAPVVIYSCTSSSPEDAPRGMTFLYDPHRFNVATSRAQGVVIVVASPRLFEPECRTPEQMRWANGLCRYREMAKVV